ncbi:MAG: phosphopantetheine-binding protein [Coriobacteriales bacterium]|nr:phosphopantetheine-binding protein [Coriobacteriales bacterium]
MNLDLQFKEILAQYCDYSADEITNDMRFREDLAMSSLDFATLLGEIEDEFDIEFEEVGFANIMSVGKALEVLEEMV